MEFAISPEVLYAILGWLLATVGTAVLRWMYVNASLWWWEKRVLSSIKIFAYDEERKDIYAVLPATQQYGDFRYELVVHVDAEAQRYHRCMSYIARHFNRSLRNLEYTRRKGDEVTYRKNREAYVLKPYTSIADLPTGFHDMSREEIIEHGKKI